MLGPDGVSGRRSVSCPLGAWNPSLIHLYRCTDLLLACIERTASAKCVNHCCVRSGEHLDSPAAAPELQNPTMHRRNSGSLFLTADDPADVIDWCAVGIPRIPRCQGGLRHNRASLRSIRRTLPGHPRILKARPPTVRSLHISG